MIPRVRELMQRLKGDKTEGYAFTTIEGRPWTAAGLSLKFRRLRERARAMMARQVGQMVRLVDDLLDVSRISRGKIGLRRRGSSWHRPCTTPSLHALLAQLSAAP